MNRPLLLLLTVFLTTLLARALPAVQDPAVGNVTTTAFALCWQTTESASPGLRLYTDPAGTQDITAQVRVEFQSLTADRREVRSTPASREAARQVQAQMASRQVFLANITGLQPDTDYWVRAQALDGTGTTQDESALLPLTTATRAAFLIESRQLLVDLSGAAALLGDLSGVIVRLANPDSPYPLFAVLNDGRTDSRAWFDLNHFLDPTGQSNLVTASGTTLDLTISFLGTNPIEGDYSGNQIAYDGTPLAASTSTALFNPTGVNLALTATTTTALLGQPLSLRLEARDGAGDPLPDFDRPLNLSSPALTGGGFTSDPLTDGVLPEQVVILNALGPQTITATDPVSGATTDLTLDVLAYTYPNFRRHFYGNETDPAGEQTANTDGDPFNNFLDFVFGLSPLVSDGNLQLDDNYNLTRRGGPVTTLRIDTVNGVDFRVTFLRHRDHAAMGLIYAPQFASPPLASSPPGTPPEWFTSTAQPVVLGQYGDMELVYIPYPYFTPRARKATFFRMSVTLQ